MPEQGNHVQSLVKQGITLLCCAPTQSPEEGCDLPTF